MDILGVHSNLCENSDQIDFVSEEATPRVPALDGQQEEDVVELLESAKTATRWQAVQDQVRNPTLVQSSKNDADKF